MATRIVLPEVHQIPGGAEVGIRIRWPSMDTDSVGAPVSKTEYPSKTVQVIGEVVDADLEGTNTPEDESSWVVLRDDETGDRLTRPGLYTVRRNPLTIRPTVRVGTQVAFDIVYTTA
jgi:hypothetical protein